MKSCTTFSLISIPPSLEVFNSLLTRSCLRLLNTVFLLSAVPFCNTRLFTIGFEKCLNVTIPLASTFNSTSNVGRYCPSKSSALSAVNLKKLNTSQKLFAISSLVRVSLDLKSSLSLSKTQAFLTTTNPYSKVLDISVYHLCT